MTTTKRKLVDSFTNSAARAGFQSFIDNFNENIFLQHKDTKETKTITFKQVEELARKLAELKNLNLIVEGK